jgi:hypothetical protein
VWPSGDRIMALSVYGLSVAELLTRGDILSTGLNLHQLEGPIRAGLEGGQTRWPVVN